VSKPRVYFRADGNFEIGLGHVVRSLALADMLKEDFSCHFIIRTPLETLKVQILEICESIIVLSDPEDTKTEANFLSGVHLSEGDVIVLDGYHFNTDYQKALKNKGIKVACIDDLKEHHFVADVVINHALGTKKEDYSVESYTKLYLGLDYVLLRRPFLDAIKQRVAVSNTNDIFIAFGGSDFNNHTLKAIKAVSENSIGVEIDSIYAALGGANQHVNEIKKYIDESGKGNIYLKKDLSSDEICNLIQACRLAIVPASTLSIEVLSLRIPMVCGYYVDNQIDYYNMLKKEEFALCVGNFNDLTDQDLHKLIQQGIEEILPPKLLIDGLAPSRMLSLFNSLFNE